MKGDHRVITMLLAAAVAASSPSVAATDASSRAAIAAYIERCAREWAMTAVAPDPEAMDRCLADDYQGVSSRGKVVDKAAVIAPAPTPAKAAGLWYAKPRFVTPTLAIVRGEEWTEPADGAPKRHLIWTDTWAFRDGRWQVVASQDSVVPFDRPLQN